MAADILRIRIESSAQRHPKPGHDGLEKQRERAGLSESQWKSRAKKDAQPGRRQRESKLLLVRLQDSQRHDMDDDLRPDYQSDALLSVRGWERYRCRVGRGTLMRHELPGAIAVGLLSVSVISAAEPRVLMAATGVLQLRFASITGAPAGTVPLASVAPTTEEEVFRASTTGSAAKRLHTSSDVKTRQGRTWAA